MSEVCPPLRGYPDYLIKPTCLQISSMAFSLRSLKMTLFSSNRLRPSASMETIRGPNSLTWQCHRVSGIPRSRHWASTISSTSVAATTALPAGKTQWMAPNSLQARSVLGLISGSGEWYCFRGIGMGKYKGNFILFCD